MQLPASGKSELGRKCLQGPRVQTADATRIPSKSAQIAGSEQGRARECKPSKVKNEERAVPHEGKTQQMQSIYEFTGQRRLRWTSATRWPFQHQWLSSLIRFEPRIATHRSLCTRTPYLSLAVRLGITMPLTPFKLSSERPVSSTWSPTRMHSFDLSAIAMPWRQVGHRGCKGGLQPDHHSTKAHRNGQNEGTWLLYRFARSYRPS